VNSGQRGLTIDFVQINPNPHDPRRQVELFSTALAGAIRSFHFCLIKSGVKIKALDLFWVRDYIVHHTIFILSEPFSAPSVFLFCQ